MILILGILHKGYKMNKYLMKKQIEELEVRIKELKEDLNNPKEFDWKYPVGNTYFVFSSFYGSQYKGKEPVYLNHGRYRVLKQNAVKSVERNRVANRLEALYEQIEIEMGLEPFVADWDNSEQCKSSVYYNTVVEMYQADRTISSYSLGRPYTHKEVAIKVAEMLNNKEVIL